MSDCDITQDSMECLKAELDAIQPTSSANRPNNQTAKVNAAIKAANAAIKAMNARAVERKARDQAILLEREKNIARKKYCAKFKWTEVQFAKYWDLRSIPRMPGEAQSEWERLLNREEKRLKAKPRKNADLSKMTAEERAARKAKQDAQADARRRAKKAAQKDLDAKARGERPLSDEELAIVETLSPVPPSGVDEILASLCAAVAAVAAEGK